MNTSTWIRVAEPEQSGLTHPLRAVFLDVDQTLLDFDACARYALQAAFDWAGLDWNPSYFDSFLPLNAQLWDRIEDGTMSREDLRKTRFLIMFEAWNLPLENPEAFEEQFSSILHECAFLMPGALSGLKYLKDSNLPLFIISNGPSRGQRRRLEKAGILDFFEEIYTSQDFEAAKPDPVFFERARCACSRRLKQPVDFKEVLVIGDSYKADIRGALGCGMRAIWLQANRKYDPIEIQPDKDVLCAESWTDILDLLERFVEDRK